MKIWKTLILAFAALLTLQAACATEVEVTVNKEVVAVGGTIEFTLKVNTTESIGGQFILYERVNNTYSFVRRLRVNPSPSQCTTCSGISGSPVRESFIETFTFIPTKQGQYNVDANYDGAKDSKNFTVVESTTTSTTTSSTTTTAVSTTTTNPKTMLCLGGGVGVSGTSEDREGSLRLRKSDERHVPTKEYDLSGLTRDDVHTSGYGLKTFNVTFYVPFDLGLDASIYVKAGTEDGQRGETKFMLDDKVVGSCNISGPGTGGIQGRWGECTAKLNTGLLEEGEENTLTVANNIVPDMFALSFIDYDYMELRCSHSDKPAVTSTTTATTLVDYVIDDSFDDQYKADHYYTRAQEFYNESDYANALLFAGKSKEFYQKLNDSEGISNCMTLELEINKTMHEEKPETTTTWPAAATTTPEKAADYTNKLLYAAVGVLCIAAFIYIMRLSR